VKRRLMRVAMVCLLAIGLALGVAACGKKKKSSAASTAKPGTGKPAVTIGDKNFTEQFILGDLYAQALQAKGYTVTVKGNIGTSELIDKALTSGKLDMYPEYTGIILTALAHDSKTYPSAQAAYQASKTFEETRGFTLLDMTPYANLDAMGVKAAYAKQNNLKSVADLKRLGSKVTLGGPPEFRTRLTGLVGLKQKYGIDKIKFKPLAIGLQYKALDSGQVQVADVFTTDGQLQAAGKYTLLTDPKNVFGFENVAPIVNKKTLAKEGPAFAQTLNAVSAKLTLDAMRKMNAAVDIDRQSPAVVAKQFLQANGLL
jgi:osmoprotectant transport system substrate-binding protein